MKTNTKIQELEKRVKDQSEEISFLIELLDSRQLKEYTSWLDLKSKAHETNPN